MNRHARRAAARISNARQGIAEDTGRLAFSLWAAKSGCSLGAAADADGFPLRTDDDFQQAEAALALVVRELVAKTLVDSGHALSPDERALFDLHAIRAANLVYIEMASRFRDACARRVAELERAA